MKNRSIREIYIGERVGKKKEARMVNMVDVLPIEE
jgi:hypothetical protein